MSTPIPSTPSTTDVTTEIANNPASQGSSSLAAINKDGGLDVGSALDKQLKAAEDFLAYQAAMIPIQTAISTSQSIFSSISAIMDKASQTSIR